VLSLNTACIVTKSERIVTMAWIRRQTVMKIVSQHVLLSDRVKIPTATLNRKEPFRVSFVLGAKKLLKFTREMNVKMTTRACIRKTTQNIQSEKCMWKTGGSTAQTKRTRIPKQKENTEQERPTRIARF